MTTRSDCHLDTADEFLGKARAYLEEGDLLQASEKGWGAAARTVKAVAEHRGWRNSTHGHLFGVVDRLVDETGEVELRDFFGAANELHQNFYEGHMSVAWVAQNLDRVEALVVRLRGLLG
ncbi:MAG: PaREP1 family protein [Chloroflexota bacterium]|nr:PaREP1 family protein [Chloroflexota bacterium]